MTDELTGKIIADKYRIDSLLRESDLGPIYRGWHVLMDKAVTIKILATALAVDQRFVKRFLVEAKTASQANHANILNVTDFGTDAHGISYTVYEGAEGETLSTSLGRNGALSVSQSLNITAEAAAGLAAAHAKGLFHGSLSPEKILVAKEEETEAVKIFDFGVEPVGKRTMADIEYLAPEQYTDPTAFDARSDIYSLAVIFYEMLAGEAPFTGKTTAELAQKQESEPPPPLSAFRSDMPADLEPMILSAMANDPERRYQTMAAFAEDLEHLSMAVSGPVTAVAAAAPKRNVWQTAFIVLVGISLLAGVLIYATSTKRTDPTSQTLADAGSLPVQPIGPATGAQEESLARLPVMSDTEILANSNSAQLPGTTPGGDGFNAWANGGPPAGAPLNQTTQPGGQTLSGDPNAASPFMPGLDIPQGCTMLPSGIVLCPKLDPGNTAKPTPTPKKNGAANSNTGTTVVPKPTPKPAATPPKTDKSAGKPGNPE